MDDPRVAYEKPADQRLGEPSEVVQARVETARERQRTRLAGMDLACNADTRSGPADVRKYCKLDKAGNALIKAAMTQLQLSARAFSQIPEAKRKRHRVAEAGADHCRFGREWGHSTRACGGGDSIQAPPAKLSFSSTWGPASAG